MTLQHLPLSQLSLIVDDILGNEKRRQALALFDPTGRVVKRLEARKGEADGLPPELKALPLTERAAAQDDDHDARAKCLYRLAEVLRRWPDRTPAMVAAATFILTDLVPSLEVTTASFGEQVAHATSVKDSVEAKKDTLAAVVTPDGKDLYQWASSFVRSGALLGEILAERGDTIATAKDRRAAVVLRPRLAGDLTKLRDDVREALEIDPNLPRDLDAQIFGYADELARLDHQRRQAAPSDDKLAPSDDKPATPEPSPAPTPAADGPATPTPA